MRGQSRFAITKEIILHSSLARYGIPVLTILSSAALVACGGSGETNPPSKPAVAVGAQLQSCSQLMSAFKFANTTLTSVESVAAGVAKWGSNSIGAHCLVKGEKFRRTSPQDGKSYAIEFEMRMPTAWNGRFFYQANGGY